MEINHIINYCLNKKGAYKDYPFEKDFLCIKVKGKIFAQLFHLNGIEMLTINHDRMTGEFYRSAFSADIKRGYHCPPVQQPYFSTVDLSAKVPDHEIIKMIDSSYSYVVSKLSKKLQKELEDEG